jgi:mRNA degradation ribonuclease J1/J2
MASLTVYDGAHCIGGNKIHLEENGRGILLDFGMNFASSANPSTPTGASRRRMSPSASPSTPPA